MSNKRILIIGDSTGYTVRPYGKKFHSFLLEVGYLSTNLSNSAVIIDDLLNNIPLIVANDYDYIILPLGINDISPRPYNYKLFKVLNKKRYLDNIYYRNFQKFNHGFNKFIAPILIKLFALKGVNTPKQYVKKLNTMIDLIKRESSSNIIIFTIPETNEKLLKYLPNLNILINETNSLLRKIDSIKNIRLVDVDFIVSNYDRNLHLPDGVHYSEDIHKEICKKIIEIIDEKK